MFNFSDRVLENIYLKEMKKNPHSFRSQLLKKEVIIRGFCLVTLKRKTIRNKTHLDLASKKEKQ